MTDGQDNLLEVTSQQKIIIQIIHISSQLTPCIRKEIKFRLLLPFLGSSVVAGVKTMGFRTRVEQRMRGNDRVGG